MTTKTKDLTTADVEKAAKMQEQGIPLRKALNLTLAKLKVPTAGIKRGK